MRLRVSGETARDLLEQVEHKTFEAVVGHRWQVDRDGNVRVHSICWLFCWAVTGINSPRTAEDCRRRFNMIFDKEDAYKWFRENIGHEFARKFRDPKRRVLDL